MLKLVEFIKNNNDWEQKLSEEPYYVKIKRKDGFIIFNYSQISSDFTNEIVRECRGVILDDKFVPVCVPFFKFGNYGENYIPEIDWNSARVQEKVDGSLISVWNYNDEWYISTSGNIDASDSGLIPNPMGYNNFKELFLQACNNCNFTFDNLNKTYTYMFELVSPYNRVVVPYPNIKIYHIGTRNNLYLRELEIDVGIQKPKSYNISNLNDCVEIASKLPFDKEGYVVVDSNWNRIKIKSPAYVAAHHIKNNGIITNVRIIDMLKTNEQDEFLNYFPEFKEAFGMIQNKIDEFVEYNNGKIQETINLNLLHDRKEFAKFSSKTKYSPVLFLWYDGRCDNIRSWLMENTSDKICKILKL